MLNTSVVTDFFVDGIRKAIDTEAQRLMNIAIENVTKELFRRTPEIIAGFLINFNNRIDVRDETHNLIITIQKKDNSIKQ